MWNAGTLAEGTEPEELKREDSRGRAKRITKGRRFCRAERRVGGGSLGSVGRVGRRCGRPPPN